MFTRRIRAFASALTLTLLGATAPASAQQYYGVALRWDHCYAEGTGAANKNFACDTNTGSEKLVGSFNVARTR